MEKRQQSATSKHDRSETAAHAMTLLLFSKRSSAHGWRSLCLVAIICRISVWRFVHLYISRILFIIFPTDASPERKGLNMVCDRCGSAVGGGMVKLVEAMARAAREIGTDAEERCTAVGTSEENAHQIVLLSVRQKSSVRVLTTARQHPEGTMRSLSA